MGLSARFSFGHATENWPSHSRYEPDKLSLRPAVSRFSIGGLALFDIEGTIRRAMACPIDANAVGQLALAQDVNPHDVEAVVRLSQAHPFDGPYRVSVMLLDANVAVIHPQRVKRLQEAAGLAVSMFERQRSVQPLRLTHPHQVWYLSSLPFRLGAGALVLLAVMDGYSRNILHWDIARGEDLAATRNFIEGARSKFSRERPMISRDFGIDAEFQCLLRRYGFRERSTLGPQPKMTIDAAREVLSPYVEHYNTGRLNRGIGYLLPKDVLEGHGVGLLAQRERRAMAGQGDWKFLEKKEVGPNATSLH